MLWVKPLPCKHGDLGLDQYERAKPDQAAHISNIAPTAKWRWVVEKGKAQKLAGQLGWHMEQETARDPVSKEKKKKDRNKTKKPEC